MTRAAWLRVAVLLLAAPFAGAGNAGAEGGGAVRALLVPLKETVLSSQLAGRVDRIAVREGENFKRGQVLVSFDCSIQRAQSGKARAELDAAEKSLDAQKRLAEMRSGSALDASLAAANVAKAKAEMAMVAATLELCEVRAPFDGRVVERKVKQHQSVSANQPLIEILDDSALEVQVIIPSAWVTSVKAGSRFTMRVDETGRDYPGKIVNLGARIDPASQSLRAVGQIDGHFAELLAGMSGQATFAGK